MPDPRKALEYVESLTSSPEALAIDEGHAGFPVQPTVGPLVAAVLDVLARAARPAAVLEIGTSLGYAACVLGRAVRPQGGSVVTIEIDPRRAGVARRNIEAAGLAGTVRLVEEDAGQALARLPGPFGMILQDGAKEDYVPLLDPLVRRLAPGGFLVTDDILFPVMEIPKSVSHWAEAVGEHNRILRSRTDLRTSWLPIGDGVALSVRIA